MDELKDADFQIGLSNKLMGQVNLVRIGRQYIHDNRSFTLTSGVLSREPMKGNASISTVNAGRRRARTGQTIDPRAVVAKHEG